MQMTITCIEKEFNLIAGQHKALFDRAGDKFATVMGTGSNVAWETYTLHWASGTMLFEPGKI